MRISRLLQLILGLVSVTVSAQNSYNSPLEDTVSMRKIIVFLASDRLKGREAGSHGASLASDYISVMMDKAGVEPDGDRTPLKSKSAFPGKSWFQNFFLERYPAAPAYGRSANSGEENTGYEDGNYFLPGDTLPGAGRIKRVIMRARNILGMIRGRDTTKEIIIGAHYDHLGIRNGSVYCGADDNASGVAGIITIARYWSQLQELPPCNLIFAAWTAEEKGQIGSRYYTIDRKPDPKSTLIVFNLDMIAGSAPEDSTRNQLSIGTRTGDSYLRTIAIEANANLRKSFDLDLWDVTGHSGSDYKYFSEAGIPVMTFFSGYIEGYHTPRDKATAIDIKKMARILALVNECIKSCLKESE